VLEDDSKPDPRFTATADALKKQGIDDYQLNYAEQTLNRMAGEPAPAPAKVAMATPAAH
jgi:carboxyl-terminal processing protease